MAAITQQTVYKTTSYREFNEDILSKLNPNNSILKDYVVSWKFYRIIGQKKDDLEVFQATHDIGDYDNRLKIPPTDDRELYELLKKEFSDTVIKKMHRVSAEQYHSQKATLQILQGPLESPEVQQCLNDFRRNRRGAPFEDFEEALQQIPGQYRQVQESKRLCQKKIQIVYLEENKEKTAIYEESFESKCTQCGQMETSAHKLHMCTRCHEAWYCNRDCQKAHWPSHKVTCLKP